MLAVRFLSNLLPSEKSKEKEAKTIIDWVTFFFSSKVTKKKSYFSWTKIQVYWNGQFTEPNNNQFWWESEQKFHWIVFFVVSHLTSFVNKQTNTFRGIVKMLRKSIHILNRKLDVIAKTITKWLFEFYFREIKVSPK